MTSEKTAQVYMFTGRPDSNNVEPRTALELVDKLGWLSHADRVYCKAVQTYAASDPIEGEKMPGIADPTTQYRDSLGLFSPLLCSGHYALSYPSHAEQVNERHGTQKQSANYIPRWFELSVDTSKSLVMSARMFWSKQITPNVQRLDHFLSEYSRTHEPNGSQTNWYNDMTDELFESPVILSPHFSIIEGSMIELFADHSISTDF